MDNGKSKKDYVLCFTVLSPLSEYGYYAGRMHLDLFQVKDRTDQLDRCWCRVRRKDPKRKQTQHQGSSELGELGENRWPSAPMGGLAFRTRNSPSQKTSLRWGDCCPPNPNPPSSPAVWKDRHQDMPPVPVWGCPPLLRDCTPRGHQRYQSFLGLSVNNSRMEISDHACSKCASFPFIQTFRIRHYDPTVLCARRREFLWH